MDVLEHQDVTAMDEGAPSDPESSTAAPKPPNTKAGWCHTCKPATWQHALQSHRRNVHTQTAQVTYSDGNHLNGKGIWRHVEKCNRIADPGVPLDPDQPPNGAPLTYAPAALLRQEEQYIPRPMGAPVEEDPVPLADFEPPSTPVPFILSDYLRAPDVDTVSSHPLFNLSIMDIVINTRHRKISSLPSPPNFTFVVLKSSTFPPPTLHPSLVWRRARDSFTFVIAVITATGHANRFAVTRTADVRAGLMTARTLDPSLLPPVPDEEVDLVGLFTTTRPPPINYSNIPFAIPVRAEDLNKFLYREGWLQHIEGFTSDELEDACRVSSEADRSHSELKDLVVGYIQRVQSESSKLMAFGLRKTLAKVGDAVSMATFDHLTEKLQDAYGLFLWRLISSLLCQLENPDDKPRYRYPITEEQQDKLWDLLEGFEAQDTTEDELISAPLYTPPSSHSFPTSKRITAWTNTLARFRALQCSPPSPMLTEIRVMLDANPALTFLQAYEERKVYLKDEQETPMAFLFNTYCLLKVIRSDEHTEDVSRWIDEDKMFLQYGTKTIRNEKNFFGMEPPPEISVLLDPSTFVDDLTNRSPGHSFLESLQNPLHQAQDALVKWILSVPELAKRFTYVHEGKLVWRPLPCLKLLERTDKANEYLFFVQLQSRHLELNVRPC
ncbi:hypothetical protein B0H16DRAFT_1749468 [Mycena metata]|uniref:Uncharacterized protein n=1 Tax=Mycena metata TaxID=1033252 RepID=A0AAD7DT78_9AGAR|nr:hypothetical protein B0H16DRAFT_1749468 [Mycena metata]